MQNLGLLGMYFDAEVVFVTNLTLLFRLPLDYGGKYYNHTLDILCSVGKRRQWRHPSPL